MLLTRVGPRAARAQCATRLGNIALEARISRSEVGCGELTRPTPNGVQVHENESGRRGVVTALDGSDLSSRPPPASRPTRRVRRKNAEGQLTPSINETGLRTSDFRRRSALQFGRLFSELRRRLDQGRGRLRRPSRATRQPEPPGTYAALRRRMGGQRGPLILCQRAAAFFSRRSCFSLKMFRSRRSFHSIRRSISSSSWRRTSSGGADRNSARV